MRNTKLPTMKEFKEEARALRKQDLAIQQPMQALDILAQKYGYDHWKALRPDIEDKEYIELPTRKEFKDEAKEFRINQPEIKSHSAALNLLAKIYGYENWNTLSTKLVE